MRKIILLLFVLIVIVANINAQFKATYLGYVTEDNKEYFVADIDNKTAQELYSSVNAFILKNFKNPDAVVSKVDGEMINLHGVFPDAVPCKKWIVTHYADVDLNLIVYFKDGRIRFDVPTINSMTCYSYTPSRVPTKWYFSSFFKKDDKVKNKNAVEALNKLINNFITEMIEYAKAQSNNDW